MWNFILGTIFGVMYAIIWTLMVVTKPYRWYQERRLARSLSSTRVERSEPVRSPRLEVSMMKRGVGYCENTECEDFAKGVFLLNHGDTFYCPRCRQQGFAQKETGHYTGTSEIFKEVRVEYNFDPIQKKYREIGIVRDESLWGRNNVYTLQSPLIKTEKRALKVAEAILANLNRYRGLLTEGEIPRTHEIILSFDEPVGDFSRKLQAIAKEWEDSGLVERKSQVVQETEQVEA